MTRASWVVLVLLLAGCGGDPAEPTGDASTGDAAPDAGLTVAPPEIDWLAEGLAIDMRPCPDGWREVTESAVTTCDAYGEGGPQTCDFGEAHFPGEPGCRPIGDPCPAGEWPEGLPADERTVVFVQAGATGGDGSRAAPYGTLDDVPWSVRGAGWTIALAKGTYEGLLPLRGGVTVVGACAAETILTGLAGGEPSVIFVTRDGGAPVVRNVAMRDPPNFGVLLDRGFPLVLEGVLVHGAEGSGVVVNGDGAAVQATDLVVQSTRPTPMHGGRGIEAYYRSRVEGTRVISAMNQEAAVFAGGDSEVTLRDALIRDTAAAADGAGGIGINARLGARVDATRVVVFGHASGVSAVEAGSFITLSDALVSGSVGDAETPGRGVSAETGSRIEATRVVSFGNQGSGLLATGAGSTLVLSDAVSRGNTAWAFGTNGGRGLGAQFGARVEASRVLVIDNHELGLFGLEGGVMDLSDVSVENTLGLEDGSRGRGMQLQDGSLVTANRLVVSASHECGVLVTDESTRLTLVDAVVRDTRPRASDLGFGFGLSVQLGAAVDATRTRVAETHELGIAAIGGGRFEGRDIRVETVRQSACDDCERILGYGLESWGGIMTVTNFSVENSATCGILLAPREDLEGSMDLRTGVVRGSAIGACMQVPGYDLGRVTGDVLYEDNTTNLQATDLPLPEVVGN